MTEWQRNDSLWRQGHLLDDVTIAELGLKHQTEPEKTVVLVISQDCDLTSEPRKEPKVEVVVGHLIGKKRSANAHAKNARNLHIDIECNGGHFFAEFVATDKNSVDKVRLCQFKPREDARLDPDNLNTLQLWLASRYRRSAFPDQFEARLGKKLREAIANIADSFGDHISGVFFDVDDGRELHRDGPDDTYTLDITILYMTAPDTLAAERDAKKMVAELKTIFTNEFFVPLNKWQQIELRFCEPVSEAALTYEMFRQLKKWNLDHLSLAEEPQQPIAE